MVAQRPALHEIEEFLERKRFAAVGVSRNPKDFSRSLFGELRRRGYDVVPVNPKASTIDDVPCFARLQDIHPPVEAALLLTSPEVSGEVAEDCAQAGIRQVWMYRATGAGAVSLRAVVACQLNGIDVIAGECPYMFLEHPGFPHGLHRVCKKLMGSLPR
ncbi:MAG TPA: CoA-binding protein [Candidatus Sulfopaludibacter sp.]|jgi:predicted CoA-binding protein|nr:CoA-binding protein [Candidatus Sulfopaludibacter sp.]